MRLLSRPARSVPVLLGLLLALTMVPMLAAPAQAAAIQMTGTVTGLDANGATVPVEDVYVEARTANGEWLDPRAYDYTAADGSYQITLPDAGSYWIDIQCTGSASCADYAPEPAVKGPFEAATVLNATLDRWGTVTGTVTRNGSAAPWPNGAIEAVNDERDFWTSNPGVTVDANGRFTIEKVAPGTVKLWGSEGFQNENFLSIVDGQTFDIAPGVTTDISVAVEDWPGVYVAAVDPASGEPLLNLGWQLYSRPVGGTWDNGLQMGPLLTNTDGRMMYRITDKSLEYTVCFAGTTDVPVSERRVKRCLGGSPDLAGATAWKWSAANPKLKTDIEVPLPFATVGTPSISGTAKVGATLTANAGTWEPAPTKTTFEWFRAGFAAPVGTGATYQPVAADQGKTLTVKVTGERLGYVTSSATSVPTSAVVAGTFSATPAPSISGTAKVGETLTATVPAWTPAASTTVAWFRSGVVAEVGTGSSYALTAADAGKTITAKATGTRAGYTTATSPASAPTPAVALASFTATPAPSISGTAKVGETLTATASAWTPAATTTTFEWFSAGESVGTGKTYVVTATDAGKAITVKATGARDGYATKTVESDPAPAAAEGTFSIVPTPTISGTAAVGATLTASAAGWAPEAQSVTYQWLRSGAAIPGATGATYALTAADAGATITVRVTGHRDGYVDAEASSAATAAVALAAFDQAPVPRIKGKAKVGSKLKVITGVWSPAPATTTYQWYRNGKAIKKATKAKYKVTAKDRRKRITVVVTQTLPGHATVSTTSRATKRVR